mgnify:CR=1 FL=1
MLQSSYRRVLGIAAVRSHAELLLDRPHRPPRTSTAAGGRRRRSGGNRAGTRTGRWVRRRGTTTAPPTDATGAKPVRATFIFRWRR